MDPELQQQINDQLNEMSELLRQQNSYMSNQIKMMNELNSATKAQSNENYNAANAGKNAANASANKTKLAEITANANKLQAQALQNLASSLDTGKSAILNFASAMLDVTPGLAKYSKSISSGIDAVSNIAQGFGPLGAAAGGLLKVFGGLVSASLQYSDAVVKGYDDVAKITGGLGITAEEVVEIGKQAGLSAGKLETFTKNAATLGPSIRALGSSASDGVKNFGKYIAVGDTNLRQYRKLGISQDELAEIQTKYIDMQAKTGADLRKSPEQLQKASLKYVDSLIVLGSLTGLSVKDQQLALDAALAQENFNAYIFAKKQERAEAERLGLGKEVERLDAIIKAKENGAIMAQATMGAAEATGFLEGIATDGIPIYTKNNSSFARNNFALADINKGMMEGKDQSAKIAGEVARVNDEFNKGMGPLAAATGPGGRKLMEAFGVSNKSRASSARLNELQTEEGAARFLEQERKNNEELEKKKNQEKGIESDRSNLDSNERQARLAFDGMLKQLSPILTDFILSAMPKIIEGLKFLTTNFDKIALVAKTLAGVLGTLAAVAAIGSVVNTIKGFADSIKSLFGGKIGPTGSNPLNPLHVKMADASDSLTDMTGGNKSTKKGADGRYRDSKGRFAKAPKNLLSRIGSSAKMLKYGKVLAGGLGSLLGGLALDYGADKAKAAGYAKTGAGLSVGSAALTGAGIGATAGSIIPGVGTVIGGAVGGLIGTGIGLFQNKEALFGSTTSKGSQDSLTKMIDQVQKLQKYEFNKPKVENNSSALVVFSEIMSSFKGTPESTENASLPAEIAVKFFAVKPPLKEFETFANLNIDPKKASINSKAFIDFVNTMSLYKGGPGIIDTVSSLIGKGLNSLFGPASPVEAFADFAKKDFGPKASANSEAFLKYAQAAGMMSRSGGGGDGGGTASGGSAGGSTGGSAGGGGSAGASGVAQSRLEAGVSAGAAAAGGAIAAGGQLAYNAVDWAKAKITGKPTDVLNFTARSGSYENFTALNSDMQKAVVLAATDYKQATGRKMTMNSGLRAAADQERLWAETVKRGTPGKGPTGMKVGRPPSAGGNPPHLRGNAIDLQEAKNDPSRSLPILARYGLKQTYGQKDPVHLDLMKARDGGLFEGPDKGYPSAMKMLSSLDTQSIVMKLAKTPVSTAANEKKKGSMDKNAAAIYSQNSQLTFEIAKKLDQVIDALESDNSVQGKILKHSRA